MIILVSLFYFSKNCQISYYTLQLTEVFENLTKCLQGGDMDDNAILFLKQVSILKIFLNLKLEMFGKPALRTGENASNIEIDDNGPNINQDSYIKKIAEYRGISRRVPGTWKDELERINPTYGFSAVCSAYPFHYMMFQRGLLSEFVSIWDHKTETNQARVYGSKPNPAFSALISDEELGCLHQPNEERILVTPQVH